MRPQNSTRRQFLAAAMASLAASGADTPIIDTRTWKSGRSIRDFLFIIRNGRN
jgi:hypothetical protein